MRLWCRHGTTEHQRSYWVCSHRNSLVINWIISGASVFKNNMFVFRSGLEPVMWRVESGLRSHRVLPRTNTVPCEEAQTHKLKFTSKQQEVLFKHLFVLFQSHDCGEHLAMMERVLGPIPPHLLKQTRSSRHPVQYDTVSVFCCIWTFHLLTKNVLNVQNLTKAVYKCF